MFQLTATVIPVQSSAQGQRLERSWPLNSPFASNPAQSIAVLRGELTLWALAEARSLDKQKALFQTIISNIP